MSYDHGDNAGNLGDLFKHALLCELVDLFCKEHHAPLRYVESHSGRADYDVGALGGGWRRGVGRFWDEPGSFPESAFKRLVLTGTPRDTARYPGSVSIVRRAVESHSSSFAYRAFDIQQAVVDSLVAVHGPGASKGDGFAGAREALDTFEPHLLFIDPPYKESSDWARARALVNAAPDGTIGVVWYPVYWWTKPAQIVGSAAGDSFALDAHWGTFGEKHSQDLKGCGLLVRGAAQHEERLGRLLKDIAASLGEVTATRRTHTARLE